MSRSATAGVSISHTVSLSPSLHSPLYRAQEICWSLLDAIAQGHANPKALRSELERLDDLLEELETPVHRSAWRSSQARRAAKSRGADISTNAATSAANIKRLALDYRDRHKYDRDHSTRQMALQIARKIGQQNQPIQPGTVREHLRALKIR